MEYTSLYQVMMSQFGPNIRAQPVEKITKIVNRISAEEDRHSNTWFK